MNVSVVIVNWNGAPLLLECLDAVRAQSHPALEVIVVDNGSVDESVEILRAYEWDRLKLILLPENTGFAAGNNAAIKQAKGEVVALLNNDAVPDPDWLKAGLRGFQNPKVGMVACRVIRYYQRDQIDKVGHLMYADGLNRGCGTGTPNDERWDPHRETLWPDGCAGLYTMSMIREIGLLDEDFFLYGEDAEWGMRGRWAGFSCLYRSDSRVFHKHSVSLGKFSPNKVFYVERNRIWLMVKTFPWTMILASPFYTFKRHFLNIWAVFSGSGSAGGFAAEHSKWQLMAVFFKAHWSAIKGLPLMLRKRKTVKRLITADEMKRTLKAHAIAARQITLSD
ncbi:MAG: glycosyltransferase family 2 protein [Acidobacteria bacterium]|nr:glycosyltransferase family 2 protein [Acidobacteriota bacterium]